MRTPVIFRAILSITCVVVALAGCRDEPPPAPIPGEGAPVPRLPPERLPDEAPPADPASADECATACANVAKISATLEAAQLRRISPELLPSSPAGVQRRVGEATSSCATECQTRTPATIARCLTAARDPSAIEACLQL